MYLLLDAYRQRQHMFFLIQEGKFFLVECWKEHGNNHYSLVWRVEKVSLISAKDLFNNWRHKLITGDITGGRENDLG